jgi:glutamate mutase epsilon subunit
MQGLAENIEMGTFQFGPIGQQVVAIQSIVQLHDQRYQLDYDSQGRPWET